jgi:hypothetical protein
MLCYKTKYFTIKSLALNQIEVISLFQNTILKTAAQTLQVSVINVKFLKPHFFLINWSKLAEN